MDKIIIGKVIKPQGIKGEIKVDIAATDMALASKLTQVYIDDKIFKVECVKSLVNGVFVKLAGISDRNQAELLRGKNISIERDKMPKLEEGRYLITDVIGCDVLVDSKPVGVLKDILQYGAADVYVVKGTNGYKDFMFPCLKKVLVKVDTEDKKIYLKSDILEQIAVYEDWSSDIISKYVWKPQRRCYRKSIGCAKV